MLVVLCNSPLALSFLVWHLDYPVHPELLWDKQWVVSTATMCNFPIASNVWQWASLLQAMCELILVMFLWCCFCDVLWHGSVHFSYTGVLQGRLRDTLKLIWFTPYSRGGRQVSSSGFEHVFVGEVKNSKVSGFHNWLTFLKEEGEGDLDYKGYLKKLDLGSKVGKNCLYL